MTEQVTELKIEICEVCGNKRPLLPGKAWCNDCQTTWAAVEKRLHPERQT